MAPGRPQDQQADGGRAGQRLGSSPRRFTTGHVLWGIWAVVAALLAAPTALWATHSRDVALATAREDVSQVATTAARFAENTFGFVDVVLGRLAEVAAEKDLAGASADQLCPSFVCSNNRRLSPYLLLGFVRANGDVVVHGDGMPRLNLADRDYFLAQKTSDAGLFFGAPRKTPFMEGTAMAISRRLPTKDGTFGGIAAAVVNVDLIEEAFRGLGTGKADSIRLSEAHGRVLVDWPPIRDAGVPSATEGKPWRGCAAAASTSIGASVKLRVAGLTVETCRSAGHALGRWRRDLLVVAGGETLLLVAAAMALPLLRRRLDARRRRQLGLSGLIAGTSDVQFIIAAKPDGRYVLEALTFSQGEEWGRMSARLVGRSTRELFPADEADIVDGDYRSVLASGETRRIERRIRLGGTEFVWSTLLVPLPDATGGYIFGAASDLSGDGPSEGGLRGFTENVLRREDNERRRIARELHDTTGQNLIAAGFELGAAMRALPDAPPQVGAALAEARRLVESSVAELRTLSYVLYPPLLDEAGLGLALTTLADGFGKRAGLSVAVHVAEDVAGCRWAPEVELALYRVAQEALTNVRRHAPEKAARIVLRTGAPGRLELKIENGDGEASWRVAPADPIAEGAGIRGMRDRLEALGGSLTAARRGGGFLVAASVPTGPTPSSAA